MHIHMRIMISGNNLSNSQMSQLLLTNIMRNQTFHHLKLNSLVSSALDYLDKIVS